MLIIPAIYLSRGACVSHYKGERGQATVLSRDPIISARGFEKEGARIIHLIDLDAKDGWSEENHGIAKQIAKETSLGVQYAEGISSFATMEDMFNAGIARVSLNQFSEKLLKDALERFGPEKILFTIRAQQESIEGVAAGAVRAVRRQGDDAVDEAVHDFSAFPKISVVDYAVDMASRGVTQIIFRDTKSEGTLHPNFDEIERLILGVPVRIFSFGGVGTMADLEILEKIGTYGVIVSRAFFEKRLSARECIKKFEK